MMECLLFLWWNFALYLACYDRTCYLDETLHCNMYMDGTCLCMNNVYGWNLLMYEQCVWMKLMWYVICDMKLMCWIFDMKLMCWICDMEIYLYMSYIFAVKIVGLKKTEKKRQYARSLPSATDGKEIFAISSGRQRGHVAGNCASWEADQFG